MNLPKFFPLVIEIVIGCDGKQSFIIRHTNGNVLAILDDHMKISDFVKKVCTDLVMSVPSQVPGVMPDSSSVENVKKSVRAK